jgi:membrane protease subunit (stomatin/prohibitin family)
MGIIDAAFDSLGGVLSDQWKDVITAGHFDEHTVVAPAVRRASQNGRGANRGAEDILTNGSVIYVPEGTAAFVFSQSGIERVISQPGGYEYRDGEATVFDAKDRAERGLGKIILDQAAERVGFSGMSPQSKRVAFVNLREIRGIKFGTHGPLAYNDAFYGCDLEVYAYGTFSVQVVDPERLVRSFVPANATSYSLDNPKARGQLTSEFLQSFLAAINRLSASVRISQLPGESTRIADQVVADDRNAGTWEGRFGLRLVSVGIEDVEFTDESRELVRGFSERKMGVRAYEGVSRQAADISAQQLIAEGVRENGLGDAGGMLFGMNLATGLDPRTAGVPTGGQAAPVATSIPSAGGAQAAGETGAGSVPAAGNVQGAGDVPAAGGQRTADVASTASASAPSPSTTDGPSFDQRVEMVKKLKELLDAGILTQEEFDAKKRDVLGL